MALFNCKFFSKSINISTSMNVILPDDNTVREYPTLYLLHGYSDDYTAWLRWTSVERYARDYKLAVVMPDVQKSFYNDFPGIENGYKYWTFVSEELIEVSRRFFRLSRKREDTFVAGLSMGGFGAFKCAFNRPDIFSAAASFSGALDIVKDLSKVTYQKEVEMITGGVENVKGSANDLFAAAEKTAKLPEKPRLYQHCGTEDFLYDSNIRFRDFIQELGYDYTYEECSGGHEWAMWDGDVKRFIDSLGIT